jgi:hypothetical protein
MRGQEPTSRAYRSSTGDIDAGTISTTCEFPWWRAERAFAGSGRARPQLPAGAVQSLWSTTARVVVTDPALLDAAEAAVREVCDDVRRDWVRANQVRRS